MVCVSKNSGREAEYFVAICLVKPRSSSLLTVEHSTTLPQALDHVPEG